MTRRFMPLIVFAAFFAMHPAPVLAGVSDGIAAVVNDGVVTTSEVNDRIDLIVSSSGMPRRDPRVRDELRPRVLDGLVTELIQTQEAKNNGITVSEDQVAEGLQKIANENQMDLDQFRRFLKSQHVNPKTLEHQITAQVAWMQLVQKNLRPQITVSESEIAAEKERIAQHAGQTEFSLAEIYLPFTAADESDVGKFAAKLIADMKKGARFSELARQFSKSPTASAGGAIGWLRDDQLDPVKRQAVAALTKENPLSDPIRGDGGYYILLLRDSRVIVSPTEAGAVKDSELQLRDVLAPVRDGNTNAALAVVNAVRRDTQGCEALGERASRDKAITIADRTVQTSLLPQDAQDAFRALNTGEATAAHVEGNRVVVTYLCNRRELETSAMDEQIANQLGTARLDILAKRYLRDLLDNALVERRL